jgi:cytochrome c
MIFYKHSATLLTVFAAFASISFSSNVLASKELAQKSTCMSCHGVDKKVIGPAFTAVAAKYKDEKEALANVAKAIKTGGAGKYGPIPMPAQTSLSESDAVTLAKWILAGAK